MVEALITLELLKWAREERGWSLEMAIKRTGYNQLPAWESGERSLSVEELRWLSFCYHQSMATFYLPSPPEPVAFLIGELPIRRESLDKRAVSGERWELGDFIDAVTLALAGKPVKVRALEDLTDCKLGVAKGTIVEVVSLDYPCDEIFFVDPYSDEWCYSTELFELMRGE